MSSVQIVWLIPLPGGGGVMVVMMVSMVVVLATLQEEVHQLLQDVDHEKPASPADN